MNRIENPGKPAVLGNSVTIRYTDGPAGADRLAAWDRFWRQFAADTLAQVEREAEEGPCPSPGNGNAIAGR